MYCALMNIRAAGEHTVPIINISVAYTSNLNCHILGYEGISRQDLEEVKFFS